MNEFLIVNTRDGQHPNVLGASYVDGIFMPQLVCSTDGHVPSNLVSSKWSLEQFQPGLYYLKIKDQDNRNYILGLNPAESDVKCYLYADEGKANFKETNSLWAFPYPTRIMLVFKGMKDNALSLDAGSYPDVKVYNFNSNENQTWQFGPDLDTLSGYPPMP